MRNTQSGVMLLEALIGILIFSVGILAMVGMQAIAIRLSTDARDRAEASNLAEPAHRRNVVEPRNVANYALYRQAAPRRRR